LINTCARIPYLGHPHKLLNEDAMMASEPTLSLLAQLAETLQLQTRRKEQQRRYHILMPHKVVDEADVILLVLDASCV
jgi:hypothetical protein